MIFNSCQIILKLREILKCKIKIR